MVYIETQEVKVLRANQKNAKFKGSFLRGPLRLLESLKLKKGGFEV